jgi:hypothetical protein
MTQTKQAHYVIQKFEAEEYENSLGYSMVLVEGSDRYVVADMATIEQIVHLLNAKEKRIATDKIDQELRTFMSEKRRLNDIKEAVETLTETQKKLFQHFIDFDKMYDKRALEELERKEKKLEEKRERIRSGNYSKERPDVLVEYSFEEVKFELASDILRQLY